MATLQVNIEIPEEEFKKICIENINDLPKKQIQELLIKAMETALINDNNSSTTGLFKQRNVYSYGSEPTPLMMEIVKTIAMEQYLEPLAKEVAEYIKDNYTKMVSDYIVAAFTNLLFSAMHEHEIKSFIQENINSALTGR